MGKSSNQMVDLPAMFDLRVGGPAGRIHRLMFDKLLLFEGEYSSELATLCVSKIGCVFFTSQVVVLRLVKSQVLVDYPHSP